MTAWGRLILVKSVRAFNEISADKVPPYVTRQMAKVAAEISDTSWNGAMELDQTATQETLPAEGYDVLDSLRGNPDVAPLLVRLQELGVDLEPEAEPDGDELAG